jgi:hypothetical protein
MSVFVSTCSSTAHRPFGHMAAIGIRSAITTDRQAEAVAEMLAERVRRAAIDEHISARRATWANCDRRPLAMDCELT